MERILELHAAGGRPLKELAASAGVPLSTVAYWRRRIAASASPTLVEQGEAERGGSGFVELRSLGETPMPIADPYIVKVSEATLSIPRGFDAREVHTLMAIVDQRC